jgi:hypothetical protein
VHVGFLIFGALVINYVGNAININSASCHIGSN